MEKDMEKEKLRKLISELETQNDQLITEFRVLDTLLRKVGFEDGLVTLKSAAQELLHNDRKELDDI